MKISVIIPMYNEEDNVLRTLVEVNSTMKDYEDYEIVAVDDGSKDDTFRLAEEVSSHNSHIKVLNNLLTWAWVGHCVQALKNQREIS
jgi:dolichol-phosphate mannosyltransferase